MEQLLAQLLAPGDTSSTFSDHHIMLAAVLGNRLQPVLPSSVGPYFGDNTYERRATLSDSSQDGVALAKRGAGMELTYETPNSMMGWAPHFGDNTYERRAMLNRR